MKIKTKYDIGQEVYVIDYGNSIIKQRKIKAISINTCGQWYITDIGSGDVHSEDKIYTEKNQAKEELKKLLYERTRLIYGN